MSKNVDVRCNVSSEFKTRIKLCAIAENLSVSKWLYKIIEEKVYATEQESETAQQLENELQKILLRLANSATLSADEREQLKKKKTEIKGLLSKVK